MHELAITQSVVDAVTERTGKAPVASVRLRIGRLAGVVPDAVRFCFELVTAGTPLEGGALHVEDGQPPQPAGQPPGAVAEQREGGRHQHHADDEGVEQDARSQREGNHLDRRVAGGERQPAVAGASGA